MGRRQQRIDKPCNRGLRIAIGLCAAGSLVIGQERFDLGGHGGSPVKTSDKRCARVRGSAGPPGESRCVSSAVRINRSTGCADPRRSSPRHGRLDDRACSTNRAARAESRAKTFPSSAAVPLRVDRRADLHPLRQVSDSRIRQLSLGGHVDRIRVIRTAASSGLCSGLPGTITGPDSLPRCQPSRLSKSRLPPSLSAC